MSGSRESPDLPARRVSRAPVLVLIGGLGLALILVLIGAQLAAAPAPVPQGVKPGTSASPRAVNVIMREYGFDPTPIYLVPGETVRFEVFNGGMLDHELALGDAEFQRAWSEANAAATPPGPFATAPPASARPDVTGLRLLLPSGAHATVEYGVPQGAALALVCQLPGHAEQGMVGQVVMLDP